jgi:hypothetical protein
MQASEFALVSAFKIALNGQSRQNSLLISLLAGNLDAETGSTSTASRRVRLYEAGRVYTLPPALAHAASKRELVAKERPADWTPPNMFRRPEVLTAAEVVEAEAELRALQRHALEIVNPNADQ